MKKNYLYNIVKDTKNELPAYFSILKEKYPNTINFDSIDDLIKNIKSKELLDAIKTLISNFKLSEKVKDALLTRLDDQEEKDPIVIGITGTVGKTSIAYLLCEYFKAYGKKVTLLSSAEIDNPLVSIAKDFPIFRPIISSNYLKSFVRESLNYNSDIIIVEVSEESIRDGYVDGIPFDIKILSHFWSNWLGPKVSDDEYFQSKSKFFEKEDDVMYFINNNSQMLRRFIDKVKNYKLFGARVNSQGISDEETSYIETQRFLGIKNQACIIKGEKGSYTLKSKNMFGTHYLMNFACIVGVLEYLNMLDENILNQVLLSAKVPGREVITAGDRTFIVTLNYANEINFIREYINKEYFEENKQGEDLLGEKFNYDILKVKVLDGIEGYAPHWLTRDGEPMTEEYYRDNKEKTRDALMYHKAICFDGLDEIYLAPNNPGFADPEELVEYLRELYEPSQKPITTFTDRRVAIDSVVWESQPGDVIIISGRGSYQFYEQKDETIFFTDSDIVKDTIKNTSWGKDLY